MTRTVASVSFIRRRTRAEPMNPAPPVTMQRRSVLIGELLVRHDLAGLSFLRLALLGGIALRRALRGLFRTISVTVAVTVAVAVVAGRVRIEGGDAGNLDVVDHDSQYVGAGLGEAARTVLDRLEVSPVGTAHDDHGVRLDRERDDVADDAVRRRVDDDAVVVRTGPGEELADGIGTEDRGRRHPFRRKRADDVEPRHGNLVDELGEVRRLAAIGRLQRMREAAVRLELDIPDAGQARTAQVEVDVKDLLAGLGMGDRNRGRGDGLALARLRGDDDDAAGERLVARRVQEVAQARDRLGELRVLVLDGELGDLFAALAADVRQHGEHFQRQAALDVREVHDGVLEVVDGHHEEQAEPERQDDADAEDDDRVRQDRLSRLRGLASDANDLVVGLRLDARLVLVELEALEHAGGDAELGLELSESGLREDDALLDRGQLVPEVLLLRARDLKLVADDVQARASGLEAARGRVEETLLG